MPNWVASRLIIDGKNSDKVMKNLLVKNEDNDYRFDFEKIIPMPNELKIVAGSITEQCISYYLSKLTPNELVDLAKQCAKHDCKIINKKQIFQESELDKIKNEIIARKPLCDNSSPLDPVFYSEEDIVKYGKNAVDNLIKYGCQDWYEWSIQNWGSKWNACNCEFDEACPNEIYFETAWSDVRKVIRELSKQYPENEFTYEYAEEQIGLYTGISTFKNGNAIQDVEFVDNSKEAYEESFYLWGDCFKEDYKFNEEKNTYEYIDDEDDNDEEM